MAGQAWRLFYCLDSNMRQNSTMKEVMVSKMAELQMADVMMIVERILDYSKISQHCSTIHFSTLIDPTNGWSL